MKNSSRVETMNLPVPTEENEANKNKTFASR